MSSSLSKSEKVKELVLNGRFDELIKTMPESVHEKARKYFLSKLAGLRKARSYGDPVGECNGTSFMRFALDISPDIGLEQIVALYNNTIEQKAVARDLADELSLSSDVTAEEEANWKPTEVYQVQAQAVDNSNSMNLKNCDAAEIYKDAVKAENCTELVVPFTTTSEAQVNKVIAQVSDEVTVATVQVKKTGFILQSSSKEFVKSNGISKPKSIYSKCIQANAFTTFSSPTKAKSKLMIQSRGIPKSCPPKEKNLKDGNVPKDAASAYTFFYSIIQKENPGMSMTELSESAAKRWRLLPDEAKLPFIRLENDDKVRAARENDEYEMRYPGSKAKPLGDRKHSTTARRNRSRHAQDGNDEYEVEITEGTFDNYHENDTTLRLKRSRGTFGSDHLYTTTKRNDLAPDDKKVKNDHDVEIDTNTQYYDKKKPIRANFKLNTRSKRLVSEDLVTSSIDHVHKKARNSSCNRKIIRSVQSGIMGSPMQVVVGKSFTANSPLENGVTWTKRNMPMKKKSKPIEVLAPSNRVSITLCRMGLKPALLPVDYIPKTETYVVVILRAYKDFIECVATVDDPDVIMQLFHKEDDMKLLNVGSSAATLHCQVVEINRVDAGKHGSVYMLRLSANKTIYELMYVPLSSPLLSTDTFLLDSTEYTKSLKNTWLVIGAPVRRGFAMPPNEDCEGCQQEMKYFEGVIYHVNSNMKDDPYQSVLVTWLDQDEDHCWVYNLNQTDNSNSPWDLQPSELNQIDISQAWVIPKSIRLLTHGDISAGNAVQIVDYLAGLDISYPFLYRLNEHSDFVAQFPSPADQLDLHIIRNKAKQGYYSSGNASVMSSQDQNKFTSGWQSLLKDLYSMCKNGKTYNDCSQNFQVWRIIDMFEKVLDRMHQRAATLQFKDIYDEEDYSDEV